MSIILNPNIRCFSELKTEYPAKVVALDPKDKPLKAFSSISIGVVNLMPTKEVTEQQWSTLMISSEHWIEPVWIQMESYTPTHTDPSYLNKTYITCSEVDLKTLQGLIITGAPVELMNFEKVLYWQELSSFLDRVMAAHIPILSVCWGAQALMYKRFGIEKHELEEKCFGIFEHRVSPAHPLVKNLREQVFLPHSRHTGWRSEEIEDSGQLNVLIQSEQAGIFALEDQDGNVYWSGHPEYEVNTLLLEYERDLAKELDIQAPKGYARNNRGQWGTDFNWQEVAKQLLSNWVDGIRPLSHR